MAQRPAVLWAIRTNMTAVSAGVFFCFLWEPVGSLWEILGDSSENNLSESLVNLRAFWSLSADAKIIVFGRWKRNGIMRGGKKTAARNQCNGTKILSQISFDGNLS